jgi:putative endonuclease
MFYVYTLYSESIGSYYVGSTNDVKDRLYRHNAGQSRYTVKGLPWRLIHVIELTSRSEAVRLERKIKKRGIKRFLIDSNLMPDS